MLFSGRRRRLEIIAELERLIAAERGPIRAGFLRDLLLYAEVGRDRNKLSPNYVADNLSTFDAMADKLAALGMTDGR